ncbi:MAG: substrate-binding domain-containing protein [Acidimicrobiales bacterium]
MKLRVMRLLAILLALAMVAAACGDDDDTSAGDDGSTSSDDGGSSDDGSSDDGSSDDGGAAPDLAAASAMLRDAGYSQVADAVDQAEPVDGAPGTLTLADGSTFELNDRIAEKIANGDEINYVFSYQSTVIALFSEQYRIGYEATIPAAQSILPMNPQAIAPAVDLDIPQQISQIEALLNTNQIDCLTIEPPDSNAFTDITNRAMSEGIPVFTVGVTSNGNELTNFTQIPLEEGRQAAQVLLDWMDETGNELDTFTVSGGDPSAFWAQGRMQGFEDGITEAMPDATFLNTADNALNVTFDPAQTFDAYQALINGQPDLDFILNVDIGAEHAARAIQDSDNSGEIFTMGWNVSVGQLDAIEAGDQVAAFDQRWTEQAGFGAPACAVFLATGQVPPNTQQLGPVTAANVDEARASLEQLGVS